MKAFTVANPDGSIEQIPCCQFEISRKQQVLIMGTDFDVRETISIEGGLPGIDTQQIGKLEDQNAIFEIQLTNSLNLEGWDLEQYPNPEIILITDNRILNEKVN